MILRDLSPTGYYLRWAWVNNRTKLRGRQQPPLNSPAETNTAIHTTHLPTYIITPPQRAGSNRPAGRLYDNRPKHLHTSLILLLPDNSSTRKEATGQCSRGIWSCVVKAFKDWGFPPRGRKPEAGFFTPDIFARAFQEGHPVFSLFFFASFLCMIFPPLLTVVLAFGSRDWIGSDRTGSVPGYRIGLSRSERDTGTHKPPE
jgi:hypothetical protein